MWKQSTESAALEPVIFSRIGSRTTIKGVIESQEDLYIDGDVQGEVIDAGSCRLVIGPQARVTARARGRDVTILGRLNGDVDATGKTSVRKTGSVIGDIRTAGVVIDEEAFFKGSIVITNSSHQDVADAAD